MGVDSGLPDFRGNEGFWKAYPVVARLGLSFAEMANPAWFRNEPELAWAFYGHRLNLYRRTKPHAGFTTLLKWAHNKPKGCFVFTSNVDGQFQKAGFDPELVEECHGSIHHFQCAETCMPAIWEANNDAVPFDETTFRARKPLPRCPQCGGMARPNIMMFGDSTWLGERNERQHQRFQRWLRALKEPAARLAVVELGAGKSIPTVRHASERIVGRLEGRLIRINPRESDAPHGHFGIALGALEGIRQLDEVMADGL